MLGQDWQPGRISDAERIVAGIEHATQDCPKGYTAGEARCIINISWVGRRENKGNADEIAVNKASKQGIMVVLAAGNSRENACNISPARAKEAITVGAINDKDTIWDWGRDNGVSNWGKCVNVYAPGDLIKSARKEDGQGELSTGTSIVAPRESLNLCRRVHSSW